MNRFLVLSVFAAMAWTQISCGQGYGKDEYDEPGAVIGTRPVYPGLPRAAQAKPVEADMGPVKIRFYGTLVLNIAASDSGVFGQDLPLWALPDSGAVQYPDGTVGRAGNNHDLNITVRQSVLGFTLNPAKPGTGWNPSALVEVDFFGTRPSDGVQPLNRVLNQPRLRLGYFQLEHKSWKIVAGQDKMILAPLDPVSLSHVAIPLGGTAGNLWAWLPQLRVDYSAKTGKTGWLFQLGILRPEFEDPRLAVGAASESPAPGTAIDTTTSGLGARSSQPFYQARIAVSPQINGSAATFGIAGHFGQEKIGVNHNIQSWAVAVDMNVRLERHVILRGEGFAGSNLIPFQGGVQQGVALLAAPLRIQRIGAGGGWAELTLFPKPGGKNVFYLGAGTDDPKNHNLLPTSTRGKNSLVWASYFRRITDDVTLAFEWSNWQFKTVNFVNNIPGPRGAVGSANVFDLSLAYQF